MKVLLLLAVIPSASAARSMVNLTVGLDAESDEGMGENSEVDAGMIDELFNYASRIETKTNSTNGIPTTEQCCCRSDSLLRDCDGQSYKCIAFHKKPKCCKSMAQCEWQSWLYSSFHHTADKKLCSGQLNLSNADIPSTDLGFFDEINENPNKDPTVLSRDYTIIIDQSGSMGNSDWADVSEDMVMMLGDRFKAGHQRMSLWNQAGIAAAFLAEHAVEADPDGISLIFFSSSVAVYENVKSAKKVLDLFRSRRPGGSTGLTAALNEALQPDTMGRAETVLVITDGAPNNQQGVEEAIVSAARQLCRDQDLAITFLQVGSASGATRFLEHLDDNLEEKYGIFDIVDAMNQKQFSGKTFLQIIESGIHD